MQNTILGACEELRAPTASGLVAFMQIRCLTDIERLPPWLATIHKQEQQAAADMMRQTSRPSAWWKVIDPNRTGNAEIMLPQMQEQLRRAREDQERIQEEAQRLREADDRKFRQAEEAWAEAGRQIAETQMRIGIAAGAGPFWLR